jgi:hypothetical protein
VKKLILSLVLFFGVAGATLFSWEANDLTKFPAFTKDGDWILNLGVGFGSRVYSGNDYIYIPPIRFSFDRNTGLGDKKLPFFFGGLVGYSGEGRDNKWDDWFVHKITAGFRVGYHFNWGVERLDTYAVSTAGWIFHAGDFNYFSKYGSFMFGVNAGVRYFVTDWFGFWAEVGYTSLSVFDIGISFKF